jgi:YfiH family protein
MLTRITQPPGVVIYRSTLLTRAGLPHAFTTRLGGHSPGPYDSLNLSRIPGPGETQDQLDRNLELALGAAGLLGRSPRLLHQVHGCGVVSLRAAERTAAFTRPFPQADALVSDDPGDVLIVRVADCLPILLADSGGAGVGAIHAGWRGLVEGVIPRAVAAMRERMGVTADRLLAAIGPGIGVASFEVGEEVAAAFRERLPGLAIIEQGPRGRAHVDLAGTAERVLRSLGVGEGAIDRGDRCTHRDEEEFFSHRRDRGVTGRQAALIGLRGPA